MRLKSTALAGVLSAFTFAAGTLLGATGPAGATTPPYEPDTANELGGVSLYDAAGNLKTSGHVTDAPFASYAVASAPGTSDIKASLYGYTPKNGQAPLAFSGEQMAGPTTYPVTDPAAPAVVRNSANPVVALTSGDYRIADLAADFPNAAPAGDPYEGLYQLRIKTTQNGGKYFAVDIKVTGDTWTQIYPTPPSPPSWKPVLDGPHRVAYVDRCLAAFDNADTVAYAWFVNGTLVPNATAAGYAPPQTAYGKSLSCRVTAVSGGGTVSGTSSSYVVGVGPALAPTAAGRPYAFQGTNRTTVRNGTREYVNSGTWAPAAPTSYLYQWYVGNTPIRGATGTSYVVPPRAWIGQYLSCLVTARRAAWTNGAFRTAGVKIV